MDKLPLDIIYLISNNLFFIDKVHLKRISKTIYYKFEITDFCNLGFNLSRKLSTMILRKYPNITKLDASLASEINDISFLKNLMELDASNTTGLCQIDQNMIKSLNLISLNVRHNTKINDVSHMNKLRKLDASGISNIDQNGINGLNLIKLNSKGNLKITN